MDSPMKRLAPIVFSLLILLLSFPTGASAKAGIGVLGGIMAPRANRQAYEPTLTGAYFVDLPLFASFHLSPYAEAYRLVPADGDGSGDYATDLGIGFNFVVRTQPLKPFAGFTVGTTPMFDELRLDVGFQAGVYWKIIANFSLVFLGRYNIALSDGNNLKRLHGLAGVKFDL
jgi:hypothetical protein